MSVLWECVVRWLCGGCGVVQLFGCSVGRSVGWGWVWGWAGVLCVVCCGCVVVWWLWWLWWL